jgi:hypothetical protein
MPLSASVTRPVHDDHLHPARPRRAAVRHEGDASGNRLAPGFYLMFCAGASLLALYAVRAKLTIR